MKNANVDYKENDNLVIGRNAVMELLKSGREIECISVAKGEREGSVTVSYTHLTLPTKAEV